MSSLFRILSICQRRPINHKPKESPWGICLISERFTGVHNSTKIIKSSVSLQFELCLSSSCPVHRWVQPVGGIVCSLSTKHSSTFLSGYLPFCFYLCLDLPFRNNSEYSMGKKGRGHSHFEKESYQPRFDMRLI